MKFLYFLSFLPAFLFKSIPNDDGELVLISVIFRHGARTTEYFYPTDPHKGESFYPYGYGSLTNEGKMGEFKLGKYLKDLYGDFLGEDYTESKVYIRSTDFSRTRTSAQLVMAGLFPPTERLTWNPELLWQPIPVDYKPMIEEDIFHRRLNCPFKDKALEDLKNYEEIQENFIKPHENLYKFVENMSGLPMAVPSDLQGFFFTLKCEDDMGYKPPEWTKSFYPDKIEQVAGTVFNFQNYIHEVKVINVGYMLEKILNDFDKKINGTIVPKDRQAFFYSGHETTIGYMLSALNISQNGIPGYGTALSFELRKKNNQFFIELRYRDSSDAKDSIDLILPYCNDACPLEDFKKLTKHLLPTLTIEEACNQNYKHGARSTKYFYPTDPYKGESFYPYGYGSLTNEGKMGEFKLGKFLKNLYGDFFGEDYTEGKVYIRSTDIGRTRTSAQLVMAGLFPPSKRLTWNPELLWQPIPVDYKPLVEEDIFHRRSNCPFRDKVLEDLENYEEIQENYIKPHENLYKFVENMSGLPIKIPTDLHKFFFTLKCEDDMGYKLPAWTKSFYPDKIKQVAGTVSDFENYIPGLRVINVGYMLKKILNDFDKKINETIVPKDRQAFFYSGHDLTIGYMFSALNISQNGIHDYGTALSFELRKRNNQFFIKLRYRDSPDAKDFIDLNLPYCDDPCHFEDFKKLTKYLLPTLTAKEACYQNYKSIKGNMPK
ncbi:unnamed protein product [Brassicogethes aeneus]|uniref:acid phosphatase n=1 Tax=Brassicogethes aeneus TaxID=1431903 RepID=A0A9P0BD87_BRAAE|nr:unnamed protein product [Brassicogethes aeneus]